MDDSQPDYNKIFSVRIVSLDYYMAPPIPAIDISYSSFQGGKVTEVPVIRVYGSTPAGQKTCLHIHRALPYFYVPCSDLSIQSEEQGDACTHALSRALEKALKLKGNAASKRQHVHECSLVRAKKFYGYHTTEDLFLKIYLYHPQDVSRAANLLLHLYNLLSNSGVQWSNNIPSPLQGGAVLDKVLQPHESHIPFLLQFLVDYNLYGMGHLHVSKMKFRNPVPDSFCHIKVDHNSQHGEQTNDSTYISAKAKADVADDSPIWISSTVPDGWMWRQFSQVESASDQELSRVKRQSTSELEGDAIVEEILNQQGLSYTSLSQAHSEMKMVPSLIPIWEEFERSGMQESGVPLDPGKPVPKDVMRTLSDGLDFRTLVELSSFPNSFSQGVETKYGEQIDESPHKLSADQVIATTNQPDSQASDKDALSLLKWLASSQAAEDINSDDELARATILSPLMPSTSIDKVLEKANMDYESESQQECQDILDSVQDGFNFDELNKKDSCSTISHNSSKTVSTETIPQMDGSSDDLSPIPHTDNNESKVSPQDHKRKRPQWGSLPVSSSKKVNDSSPHSTVVDTTIGSDGKFNGSVETYDLTEKKGGKFHRDVNVVNTESNVGQTSGKSVLVECSMRDLMRRQRSYRVDSLQNKTSEIGDEKIEFQGRNIYDALEECHEASLITPIKSSCCTETNLSSSSNVDLFSSSVSKDEIHGSIEMTFYQKPPKIDCVECETLPSTLHVGKEEYLPFFTREGHEEQEYQNIETNNHPNNEELVMGVPIHFQNNGSYLYMLTPVSSPPSIKSVIKWLSSENKETVKENVPATSPKGSSSENEEIRNEKTMPSPDDLRRRELKQNEPSVSYLDDISQISGPERKTKLTPLSQTGFRDPAISGGGQQLTIMSIEIQSECRGDLRPDPRFDAVKLIVLIIQDDYNSGLDSHILLHCNTSPSKRNIDGISGFKMLTFSDEKLLFSHFIKIIRSSDPDILVGWDIQRDSLGYLAERALHLGINLLNIISRTPSQITVTSEDLKVLEKESLDNILPESANADNAETAIIEDEWGRTHASGVHVSGRIVLNVWRLMRGEVKLNFYTLEAVAEAVLRRKVPFIACKILANWFSSGPGKARYKCIEYVTERARLNFQIMNQLDIINRTSELARVFGIDFFAVLSRGSQYRVESMFLRLARTQNYLAISPGSQQVALQPAMECIPLVMEPESAFYSDPVIVLDFQSLYPSMIIAYNLCFCTCLGKVVPPKADTLGVSSYTPDKTYLKNMKDEILLTPNGVMYVSSKVRKGVLPRLLEEILSTRIMVKKAMKKLGPSQLVLHRILDARQLALKLISNVTYGYTAAGFSGRMPCAELADSIVQCGRRTLENAISFVNSHEKWRAKVIYGDTDSMFVLLKGRSVKESHQIGQEIAAAISAMNPYPVTLKMEKVYHPCFLLTKKRYVGYSYESSDQTKPKFDAKGIETIRRDTCVAVSKMMEQSLRVFFEHQEIEKVKAYVLRQWKRILSNRVPLQDFVFAKEVRLGTYSARASSLPPAAIVASKAMRADPRAEPLYAERVPYVVVHGEPGARLVDMVVDPQELLAINSPYRLNDIYYIRKQIMPALQRAFGLVGADLNQWFSEMSRTVSRYSSAPNAHRTRIEYYYLSKHCVLCDSMVQGSAHLCHNCLMNESSVAIALTGRTSKLEREIQHLVAICRDCGGGDWIIESGIKCTSLACSVYYERRKVQKEVMSLSAVANEVGFYPKCMVEWF